MGPTSVNQPRAQRTTSVTARAAKNNRDCTWVRAKKEEGYAASYDKQNQDGAMLPGPFAVGEDKCPMHTARND